MRRTRPSPLSPDSGSAFFLILIGIFLFASLSYALIQGGRSSQANLTAEQARLAAEEIISYADTMQKAVAKLRLRGCTDAQVSFANQIEPGYTNAAAPTDGSCSVFLPAGGSVNWMTFDNAATSWLYNAQGYVIGVGSDCGTASCSDMVMLLPNLKREICEKIETILHKTATVSPDVGNINIIAKYTGTYGTGNDIGVTDTELPVYKKPTGCLQGAFDSGGANISTKYIFYQTLIAR